MLIDYLSVTALLTLVFASAIVSTEGWNYLLTQKGLKTTLLVPVLWPGIIGCIFLIGITISIVITLAAVHTLIKVNKNSLL